MDKAWAFVAVTLLGTVAGQLLLKFALEQGEEMPVTTTEIAHFVLRSLLNPLVLLSLALAFVAALAWIAAISRLDISQAYPFMALAFVLVTVLSAIFLGESVSAMRWAGSMVVVLGLIMVAKG